DRAGAGPLSAVHGAWQPRLRENARSFAGIGGGLLLPDAVGGRCTGMGGFWTGAVDHGSTAWTAQLMWLYYRYTMDEPFLRETAYPFLRAALRVYEVMLEEDRRPPTTDDRPPSDTERSTVGSSPVGGRSSVVGGRLTLPVSVSPEFGGAGAQAWG